MREVLKSIPPLTMPLYENKSNKEEPNDFWRQFGQQVNYTCAAATRELHFQKMFFSVCEIPELKKILE